MALFIESKPIRTALRWQLYTTAASTLIAAVWTGLDGACSALFGGLVSVNACAVFGLLASRGRARSAGEALIATMRAEAVKVALIVGQLWLALALYSQMVMPAFFGAFILTILVFTTAIFVRTR